MKFGNYVFDGGFQWDLGGCIMGSGGYSDGTSDHLLDFESFYSFFLKNFLLRKSGKTLCLSRDRT